MHLLPCYNDHVIACWSRLSMRLSLPHLSPSHYWMALLISHGASRVLSSTRLILRLGYCSRWASDRTTNWHPTTNSYPLGLKLGQGLVQTSCTCTSAQHIHYRAWCIGSSLRSVVFHYFSFCMLFIKSFVTEFKISFGQQEWQILSAGILIEQFVRLFCQPHVYESQMLVAKPTWPRSMALFSALHNARPCHAHSTVLGTKNLQDTLHKLAPDVQWLKIMTGLFIMCWPKIAKCKPVTFPHCYMQTTWLR